MCVDVALTTVQDKTVEYNEIEVIKKIGDGGFASVYYGVYDDCEVAVKEFDKSDSVLECFPEFRKEVSLMVGLQHPNTVGLLGICKQPLCALTEFCAFGDLYSYLCSRRQRNLPLPIEFIFEVLVDIAHGMNFLHSAVPPILHRDLKSPNVLLCNIASDEKDNENDSKYLPPAFRIPNAPDSAVTAKVADFGLSLRTSGPVTGRVVDNPIWLAPELLSKKPYSTYV